MHPNFAAPARVKNQKQCSTVNKNNGKDCPNPPEHNLSKENTATHMEDNKNNKANPLVNQPNKTTPAPKLITR